MLAADPPHSDIDEDLVNGFLNEFSHADTVRESIEKHEAVIGKEWEQKLSGTPFAAILLCFAALRILKPETVIETGCATGWTSTLLLYALHLNRKGHLYSIDIPPIQGKLSMDWTLPAGLSPGFLVPDKLRDRWTLILGDAREHLMPLLCERSEIDVFYHDSDHTYQHMIWEYGSAWPYIRPGGLLISDDIGWNTAFWDFATAMRSPISIHRSNPNFGALSKL